MMIARGVAEQFVALALPRSLDMIVGLLAVLKTGQRICRLILIIPRTASLLCYMMPSLYLCSPIVKAQVSSLAKTACLSSWMIRRIRKHFGNMPSRTLRMPTGFVRCHRFTRMSFTSGSTGVPKGVIIPHSNVIRLFESTRHWYHFNSDDVWTMFHSYAFDFSVWEIYCFTADVSSSCRMTSADRRKRFYISS